MDRKVINKLLTELLTGYIHRKALKILNKFELLTLLTAY